MLFIGYFSLNSYWTLIPIEPLLSDLIEFLFAREKSPKCNRWLGAVLVLGRGAISRTISWTLSRTLIY